VQSMVIPCGARLDGEVAFSGLGRAVTGRRADYMVLVRRVQTLAARRE